MFALTAPAQLEEAEQRVTSTRAKAPVAQAVVAESAEHDLVPPLPSVKPRHRAIGVLFIGLQISIGIAAYAYVMSQTPVHDPDSRNATATLRCDGQTGCDRGPPACDTSASSLQSCVGGRQPIGR